jgi:hypothetical protein
MTKYLLLNPMSPDMFGLETFDELIDALDEFACGYIYSKDLLGNDLMFATSKSLKTITNMVETVEIPGVVVEYTAIYDQFVEA